MPKPESLPSEMIEPMHLFRQNPSMDTLQSALRRVFLESTCHCIASMERPFSQCEIDLVVSLMVEVVIRPGQARHYEVELACDREVLPQRLTAMFFADTHAEDLLDQHRFFGDSLATNRNTENPVRHLDECEEYLASIYLCRGASFFSRCDVSTEVITNYADKVMSRKEWLVKHRSRAEIRHAACVALACIDSLAV